MIEERRGVRHNALKVETRCRIGRSSSEFPTPCDRLLAYPRRIRHSLNDGVPSGSGRGLLSIEINDRYCSA